MIKQIWFIRNERRLINLLCFAIGGFMLLYSLLSVWALAGETLSLTIFFGWAQLLLIPILSLVVSGVLFWLFKHSLAIQSQGRKSAFWQKSQDWFISINLTIVLILTFIQLDIISTAKGIAGFGMIPVFLCIAGSILYHLIRIKKLFSKRNIVS